MRFSSLCIGLMFLAASGCGRNSDPVSSEVVRLEKPIKGKFTPQIGGGTDTLKTASPNPFNVLLGDTAVHLEFGLSDSAHVFLLIQNPIGDEVIRYTDSNLYAGSYSGYWHPLSETGERLRTGIYFITLRAFHSDGRNFIASRPLYIQNND